MRRPILLAVSLLSAPSFCLAAGWRYNASADGNAAPVVEPRASDSALTPSSMDASPGKRGYSGPVPVNNMTMAAVSSKFGDPARKADPVGQPPINRWYYDAYTVYFENDRVIISVMN